MHKIVNPFPWKDNSQNMSIDWFYEKSTIYGGFRCFFKFFQLWCFKCCFFHGNGYTISWIFYFVAYFHHDTKSESSCTKSRTGNEIGQKFNFLWFPQKLTVFRKSGKNFQAFWSTELPSACGLKINTWSLNTLYICT